MDSITLDQIVPVSMLQRDYKAAIRKAKNSSDSVVLVKNNKPLARLISEKVYQQLKSYKRMYEVEETLRIVERGRREYASGKTLNSTNSSLASLIGYEN